MRLFLHKKGNFLTSVNSSNFQDGGPCMRLRNARWDKRSIYILVQETNAIARGKHKTIDFFGIPGL